MEVAARIGKAIIIAMVTFASVWSITSSAKTGLIVALVPLILGSLAILSEFVYGFAALAFLGAVTLQVIGGEWVNEGRRFADQIYREAKEGQPARGDPK